MKLRLGVSRSYFGRNKSTVLNVYTLQMLKVVVAQLYQSPAKVTCSNPSVVGDEQKIQKASLRSWRDFARECFWREREWRSRERIESEE